MVVTGMGMGCHLWRIRDGSRQKVRCSRFETFSASAVNIAPGTFVGKHSPMGFPNPMGGWEVSSGSQKEGR